ncbi:mediator of RNA polymerase II transcription subunit 6 isoform X1 [Octopus bimaculoides]|uniref:Mediator of RNA polymerase II transcription subunit 6 n=2 Tax=Octopus bimaculoides TaxID=37653 RepID=A0A0L8G0K5_OCTBM|nr:mediator of RNA polymerase II transcription subunit 6 isoform X1 [Octopus bimaculoides]|eukprot:XP_014785185.1 PREDICTED: mediator of RNA polymerase II transcription subunit 6-like isoform X1 [Octopus bimaculoides]
MAEKESLGISWQNSAWIPMLNSSNVLDYFSERTNPFYDRTCNNENVKMQHLNPEQLSSMTGLEYELLHVQEPILYVIRKQHRHSPTQVTPLADYYISAGIVYQAPDLGSVVNSRMLNTVHSLQSAFTEALSYARYHPSKGYWWEFKDKEETEKSKVKDTKKKEEPSSVFQRQRVDLLLSELSKKFPPRFAAPAQPDQKDERPEVRVESRMDKTDDKQNSSGTKVPPEKKPKLMR